MIPSGNKNLLLRNTDPSSDYRCINLLYDRGMKLPVPLVYVFEAGSLDPLRSPSRPSDRPATVYQCLERGTGPTDATVRRRVLLSPSY